MRNEGVAEGGHMKKALVLLAPGFEEIETVTVVDILRRAGIEVTVAGTMDGPLSGRSQIRILPDVLMDTVMDGSFDLLVLPGGQPGTRNLGRDPRVQKIISDTVKKEGLIAAICAAPSILSNYGFLKGKTVTSHPSVQSELKDVVYSEENVVVDGRWITSRAPGTAMAFSFKLIALLMGIEKVREVNQGVMADLSSSAGPTEF